MSAKELIDHLKSQNVDFTSTVDDRITVHGDINLDGSSLKSLPNNLTVNGSMRLSNALIEKLPDNLTVKGALVLSETPVKHLPENLTVGHNLVLYDTQIIELPESINVKGSIYGFEQSDVCERIRSVFLEHLVANGTPYSIDSGSRVIVKSGVRHQAAFLSD
jgi:hypothetical protein